MKIGILGILLIFFIVCKVFGLGVIATWSWGLVLLPLWVILGILLIFLIIFIIALIKG